MKLTAYERKLRLEALVDQGLLFDEEDRAKLEQFTWRIDSYSGYVESSKSAGGVIRMHEVIIGKTPRRMDVDHFDRNKLNNTKANLKVVPHRVNTLNSKRIDKAMGVIVRGDSFVAKLKHNGTVYWLGTYRTLDEAHQAYLKARDAIRKR